MSTNVCSDCEVSTADDNCWLCNKLLVEPKQIEENFKPPVSDEQTAETVRSFLEDIRGMAVDFFSAFH